MTEPETTCDCTANRDGKLDPDCDACEAYAEASSKYWAWYFGFKPGQGCNPAMKPYSKEDAKPKMRPWNWQDE